MNYQNTKTSEVVSQKCYNKLPIHVRPKYIAVGYDITHTVEFNNDGLFLSPNLGEAEAIIEEPIVEEVKEEPVVEEVITEEPIIKEAIIEETVFESELVEEVKEEIVVESEKKEKKKNKVDSNN